MDVGVRVYIVGQVDRLPGAAGPAGDLPGAGPVDPHLPDAPGVGGLLATRRRRSACRRRRRRDRWRCGSPRSGPAAPRRAAPARSVRPLPTRRAGCRRPRARAAPADGHLGHDEGHRRLRRLPAPGSHQRDPGERRQGGRRATADSSPRTVPPQRDDGGGVDLEQQVVAAHVGDGRDHGDAGESRPGRRCARRSAGRRGFLRKAVACLTSGSAAPRLLEERRHRGEGVLRLGLEVADVDRGAVVVDRGGAGDEEVPAVARGSPPSPGRRPSRTPSPRSARGCGAAPSRSRPPAAPGRR